MARGFASASSRVPRSPGDREGWIEFFLEGVATVSREAMLTARSIVRLREPKRELVNPKLDRAGNGQILLDALFRQPYVNVRIVECITGLSQPAANALANAMEDIGVLREVTGKQTYRVFGFQGYMELFSERQQRA